MNYFIDICVAFLARAAGNIGAKALQWIINMLMIWNNMHSDTYWPRPVAPAICPGTEKGLFVASVLVKGKQRHARKTEVQKQYSSFSIGCTQPAGIRRRLRSSFFGSQVCYQKQLGFFRVARPPAKQKKKKRKKK
jgi:hypothetical protein